MFAKGTDLLLGPVPGDLARLGWVLELFDVGSGPLLLWKSLQGASQCAPRGGFHCLVLGTVLQICWGSQSSRTGASAVDKRGLKGTGDGPARVQGHQSARKTTALGFPSQRLQCRFLLWESVITNYFQVRSQFLK